MSTQEIYVLDLSINCVMSCFAYLELAYLKYSIPWQNLVYDGKGTALPGFFLKQNRQQDSAGLS